MYRACPCCPTTLISRPTGLPDDDHEFSTYGMDFQSVFKLDHHYRIVSTAGAFAWASRIVARQSCQRWRRRPDVAACVEGWERMTVTQAGHLRDVRRAVAKNPPHHILLFLLLQYATHHVPIENLRGSSDAPGVTASLKPANAAFELVASRTQRNDPDPRLEPAHACFVLNTQS